MAPEQIGRYIIARELGRGGMAIVYLADDPNMKRQVAIKVLPRELTFDEVFRARFRREAEVIASLEHAHIVPLYDFGEQDDQPYIVMRYMPGGSLAGRIRKGSFSLREAATILEPIGAALDEAHQEGVIHRDVKPSNVLFDKRGAPFLSDFGIVKLAESSAQLTSGGIVGTPAYMAPEMAMTGGLSPLIDIYALAVTLYEMLSGKTPFQADTPMGVLMAHMSLPVPDIRRACPDLPVEAQLVIERGMAKKPEERYQSAHELAADIRALSAGQPIGVGLAAPSSNLSPEYASAPSAMKVDEPSPSEISPDLSGAASPFRPGAPIASMGNIDDRLASSPAVSMPVARSARGVRHGPPLWLIASGALLAGIIVVGTIVVGGLLLRKSAGGQKGGMIAAASNTPPSESGAGAVTSETPAATIPVTPTPLPETSYQSISLDSIANGGLDFASPPTGQVTFGEIPFTISEQVLKTQASPSPDNKYATTATLTMNIERAVRLHILIGSGNGFTQFNHKQVGDILVECSGSWVQAVSLELGQNIREWHSVGSVVSSAPDVREVWSGPLRDHPSLMGHIDLLAVGLPEPCYDGTLTGVRIEDTSTQTVDSLDPALNISGLTIETR